MLAFKRFIEDKLRDPEFKAIYNHECHVCAYTMQIFEALEREQMAIDDLADELGLSLSALERLKAADHCNPGMVIELCRHLKLSTPPACPRL